MNEWPDLFTGRATPEDHVREAGGNTLHAKLSVCADALHAWGMCMSGLYGKPPVEFGMGMVLASQFIGIGPTPEEFSASADKLMKQMG